LKEINEEVAKDVKKHIAKQKTMIKSLQNGIKQANLHIRQNEKVAVQLIEGFK